MARDAKEIELPSYAIVLGVRGRFGRAAVEAFPAGRWSVRAFGRSWLGVAPRENLDLIESDAFDAAALAEATSGCDVIVNALIRQSSPTRLAPDLPNEYNSHNYRPPLAGRQGRRTGTYKECETRQIGLETCPGGDSVLT